MQKQGLLSNSNPWEPERSRRNELKCPGFCAVSAEPSFGQQRESLEPRRSMDYVTGRRFITARTSLFGKKKKKITA